MVKVLCTIWALMLNAAKIYVFQTCCENPFEDEDTMIIGPPLPTFFFCCWCLCYFGSNFTSSSIISKTNRSNSLSIRGTI